jgi:hypothetical protein
VHLVQPSMGLKRNRPLMIDSHSDIIDNNFESKTANLSTINDIININYNDDSNPSTPTSSELHNLNDDNNNNEFINSQRQKRCSSSSIDHDYGLKKKMMRCDKTTLNKGVIINDITDNLLKSSLGDTNNSYSTTDDDQLKGPFVDYVGDSPSSLQNDIIDDNNDTAEEQQQAAETAAAESLLNSNMFINTDATKTTDDCLTKASLPISLTNDKEIKLIKPGSSGTKTNVSKIDTKNQRYIHR